jgi:hypothetical protein
MTQLSKGSSVFAPVMAWLLPTAVAGMALVAVVTYVRSEETHAAGGAPLYDKAVREAIDGLKNPGAKTAVARPALPAGLSPADHYWCEQCKAYHKRQPAQGQPAQPAGVVPAPVAGGTPATPGAQPDTTIPPLPAGMSAADYYWCSNCKIYHKRQSPQDQAAGAGAAQPPDAGTIPPMLAAPQPAAAIPPLPAGLSPADYYWCPNCKAYHDKRQAPPANPAHPTPTPPPAALTPPATPPPASLTPPATPPVTPPTPPAPAEPAAAPPPESGTSGP